MSRAWLPRRFPGALAALAGAAWFLIAPAWAQQNAPRPVTVLGGDQYARSCAGAIVAGDFSDAILDTCDRAVRSASRAREGQAYVLMNRGVLHLRRQENGAALADFDQARAFDPRSAEAQLNRGAALVQLHRYGEAVAAITEALGLGVSEPQKAYFNRAAAREALGDLRGAYEDYSTALEIQPGWALANAELARFARTRREQLAQSLNAATP